MRLSFDYGANQQWQLAIGYWNQGNGFHVAWLQVLRWYVQVEVQC